MMYLEITPNSTAWLLSKYEYTNKKVYKMKLLILAIDGLDIHYVKEWIDALPTMKKLSEEGSISELTCPTHSSHINWSCVHSGENVDTHKLIGKGKMRHGFRYHISRMAVDPIWIKLAPHNIKFGVMAPFMIDQLACEQIEKTGGWMTGFEDDAAFNTCIDNNTLSYKLISSSPEVEALAQWEEQKPWAMPVPLSHYGEEWIESDEVPRRFAAEYHNLEHLRTIVPEDYYAEGGESLYESLMFKLGASKRIIEQYPIDVLFVYDIRLDITSHFSLLHPPYNTLKQAYIGIDKALQAYIDEFRPEETVVISDHGFRSHSNIRENNDKVTKGMNCGIASGEHHLPAIGISTTKIEGESIPIHHFIRLLISNILNIELEWKGE